MSGFVCIKFVFSSKKATKIDEIFTVDLKLCSERKMDSENVIIFVAFFENMNFTT